MRDFKYVYENVGDPFIIDYCHKNQSISISHDNFYEMWSKFRPRFSDNLISARKIGETVVHFEVLVRDREAFFEAAYRSHMRLNLIFYNWVIVKTWICD
ncbi:unnamed protein product [Caenorhabditis angaria]|uniref:Uncharacterized protein n=1 Tax=Caenorhabditis angaria TaxID=860376 RepID=A0A9P1IQ74_9PELO|nr:unnamed protein product [Caenorhabditis angaria]